MVIVFLLAFVFVAPSLQGQPDVDVSVSAGGTSTSLSSTFRPLPGIPAPSDTLTFGGANSGMLNVYGSVGIDLKLFDAGISQWRFGARGSYYSYAPAYDAREVVPIARDGEVFRATLGHQLSTPIEMIDVELFLRAEVWRIGLDIGLPLGIPLSARYVQTQRFIDPAGLTFIDGSAEQETARGEIQGMKSLVPALQFRLEYMHPLSTRLGIGVYGAYRTALQSAHNVADWRPTTFGFGVGVRYNLLGENEPTIDVMRPVRSDTTRDTVVVLSTLVELSRTELAQRTVDSTMSNDTLVYSVVERYHTLTRKPPALLRVSVKVGFEQLDSTVSDDARLVSTRIRRTRIVPLLPVVMFDTGSTRIPPRYKLLKQREAQRWSEQRLVQDTGVHWQYHVLNIVGSRMRRTAASIVELIAYGDGTDAGLEQARIRAETVQQYLADVFRIRVQRLPVVVTTDAVLAQPWVYLRDRTSAVSEPIAMQDTITEAQLPRVRIVPEIVSEAGLASWSVQLVHRGRPVRTFRDSTPAPYTVSWDMREDITMDAVLVAPVVVEVVAVDAEGTSMRGEPGRISLQANSVTDASARLESRKEVLLVQSLDNLRTPDADMLPVPGDYRRLRPTTAQRDGSWFRQGLIEPELTLYNSTAVYINEERRP